MRWLVVDLVAQRELARSNLTGRSAAMRAESLLISGPPYTSKLHRATSSSLDFDVGLGILGQPFRQQPGGLLVPAGWPDGQPAPRGNRR